MALNNVTFENVPGGLGRLPASDDHVSCILFPVTPSTHFFGKFKSVEEAMANGPLAAAIASRPTLNYHIYEYFKMAGPSELYIIGIKISGGMITAEQFQLWTEGRVHQVFFDRDDIEYDNVSAMVGTIGTFADSLESLHIPAVFLIPIKDETKSVTDMTVPILHSNDNPNVSVIISGDGSGMGSELATLLSIKYVPAGGAILGLLSKAAVHENIGWVRKFPMVYRAEGVENYQKVRFSDNKRLPGDLTTLELETINDKGYVFMRTIPGVPGAYVNDTHTACDETSDYRYIENVRTIHKAKRGIRSVLLPDLNSPIEVNASGQLSPDTVAYFTNQTSRPLNLMLNAGEISAFEVLVDPEQDVLTTSVLKIEVKIVPRGTARQIKVTIGYAVSVG